MPAAPVSGHHADGGIDGAWHDPDRADGVLGTYGLCHMGGLLVATILTLVFLPTLYVTWFKGKEGSPEPSPAK